RHATLLSRPTRRSSGLHHHGDAVVVGARLEAVRQPQPLDALPPVVGVAGAAEARSLLLLLEQIGPGHRQQLGLGLPRVAPPLLEDRKSTRLNSSHVKTS